MRRKLKSDSTMKTITYGLFIYVCLTTFNGTSAKPPGGSKARPTLTEPECDFQSIIKKSKYVVDCLSTTTNVTLPELKLEARDQYLCTGIFEIAKKICKSNHTSIDGTSFDARIEELQSSEEKNNTKFCALIKDSISKTAQNSINDSSVPSNIIKLNNNLIPLCGVYCSLIKDIPIHPLCSVLYSVNEVLLSLKKPENQDPNLSQQNKLIQSKISNVSLSSPASQSITDNADAPKINTETTASPEIHKSSHKVKGLEAKPTAPKSSAENPDSTTKQVLPVVQNGGASPSETSVKKNNTQQVKIAKGESETVHDSADQIKVQGESDVQDDEKPLVSDTAAADETPKKIESEKTKQEKIDTGIESGGEQPPESIPSDDVGGSNGDGEDTDPDLPGDSGPPPPEVKDGENGAADSNHGKENKPGGKAEEPKTGQESVYPQDHTLVNSGGPPDPPQHFFAYFMAVSFICIICYIGYHKKHKIMGIIFEGRKSRGGRGRRRPNTAGYRKLDCNLEEAVTSQCNSNVTHVIY